MSFESLIQKVNQSEAALEAQERQVAADFRQLKSSWRAAWTPGRIVIAGLVTGFLTGRAEPLQNAARSGSVVRLVSLLSNMFAGSAAYEAAEDADEAADSADLAARSAESGTAAPAHGSSTTPAQPE